MVHVHVHVFDKEKMLPCRICNSAPFFILLLKLLLLLGLHRRGKEFQSKGRSCCERRDKIETFLQFIPFVFYLLTFLFLCENSLNFISYTRSLNSGSR